MLISVDCIKAIACLLIINFHCLYIYPDSLSGLSFGGDLGNNIFFLVSGFTLLPSIQKRSFKQFGSWLKSRYIRILPLSFIFNLISYWTYSPSTELPGGVFKCFVFPMVYWFIGALAIFYPLFFCVEKIRNKKLIYLIMIAMSILHVIFDSLSAERYLMGFIAMIAGAELREHILSYVRLKKSEWYLGFAFLLFIVYCFLKIVYGRKIGPERIEHLMIGVLTIVIAKFLLVWLYSKEDTLKKLCFGQQLSIKFLSRVTLASYLCQQLLNVIAIDWFLRFEFPVSIFIYLIVVFGMSYLVERADSFFRKKYMDNFIITGKMN